MKELTQEYLRSVLDYDPDTGIFRWIVRPSQRVKRGAIAGTINTKKTRYILINRKTFTAKRLAWLWVHGEWPNRRLRCVDGDITNLRLSNLTDKPIPLKCDWGSLKSRNAYIKAWNESNPGRARNAYLKSVFGITLMQYEYMHDAQDGCCAICRKPETATRKGKVKRLCVDHDHATGMVRGLLCDRCNVVLGLVKDNQDLLGSCIAYLAEHSLKTEISNAA